MRKNRLNEIGILYEVKYYNWEKYPNKINTVIVDGIWLPHITNNYLIESMERIV